GKRHGPVGLLEYRDAGILPEAMFNYLALLGWNPGEGETQEIFSRAELIEKFTLENVNKAGMIFDVEKLAHINTEYLRTLPINEFMILAQPHLPPFEVDEYARRALDAARERIRTVAEVNEVINADGKKETLTKLSTDISGPAAYFLTDDFTLDAAGAAKHLTDVSKPRLQQLRERLEALPEWNHDSIEQALRGLAEDLKIKPAELIHPARMAVSGRTVGPSIFELLEVLGHERVLRRMARARS
ncbi:MAG TPA: glutamate--tRNA ligase family protein, partial [Abditibacteriaceae bacterium]|nr:glutamate--tRNA ligase family protein [Abditibacteriaceae bacterium]